MARKKSMVGKDIETKATPKRRGKNAVKKVADKKVVIEKKETAAPEEVKVETPVEAVVEEVKAETPVETVVEEVKAEAAAETVVEEVKVEVPVAAAKEEAVVEEVKAVKAEAPVAVAEEKVETAAVVEEAPAPAEEKPAKKTRARKTTTKTTAKKTTKAKAEEVKAEEVKAEEPAAEAKEEAAAEEKPVKKTRTRKTTAKKTTKATTKAKAEEAKEEAPVVEPVAEAASVVEEAPVYEQPAQEVYQTPRRSIAFIGSECYPFVKTGGLGDVMYALPKALVKQNCDVKVILPRYKCIPQQWQDKMVYRGAFQMDLCADGRTYYVGIMEYVWDGVVYDFIDNEEFFSAGNPYISLIDDIPKYCFFSKAALAALNYMNWIPDIIHCHDWQAGLVPVYLRTMFADTPLTNAKTVFTIHNLRFQGIYNIPTIQYWSGLPDYVFNKDAMKDGWEDANMLKGGLTYCNAITTVSNTYAGEIQTAYYGEHLDAHLRYHSGKLRGIVNGIDYDIWNTYTDPNLYVNYDITNVLDKKKENKRRLQEELGLEQDDHKIVIGLISRLTNQKGLDLVNAIIPQIMDEHTQVVVLGTGDSVYEDSFRYYEHAYKGQFCANIMYDEARSHKIYAGADAFLVPSQFEPCGLTQLIAMHYGTIPIVRETGGLKDTVEPYNMYANTGNGFTFTDYDAGQLLDAINRTKTLYFTNRWCWDEMVQRDMDKNLSWDNSAKQYKDLYLELTWR